MNLKKLLVINMKVYVSYFYQIRNFNKYMIPLSTAMFDPKWYHDDKGKDNLFWDKNGIINGLRCYQFIFDEQKYAGWCGDTCEWKGKGSCPYLSAYRTMLEKIDWTGLMQFFKSVITYVANHNGDYTNIDKYNICLIVYETPQAICSERTELVRWFKEHDIDLLEWNKEME